MLYKNEFQFNSLHLLFNLNENILRIFLWSLNQLLGLFVLTTPEMDSIFTILLNMTLVLPCLVLLFVTLPLGIVGFFIRCALHQFRKPYVYSYQKPMFLDISRVPCKVAIATSNVCLLPEFLSRYNNLLDGDRRARLIGERIVDDECLNLKRSNDVSEGNNTRANCDNHALHSSCNGPETASHNNLNSNFSSYHKDSNHIHMRNVNDSKAFNREILAHFPQLDFVCFQETWNRDLAKKLLHKIHPVFPYIIYDVGVMNMSSNRFLINSGLMVASKYPVEDVEFKWFKQSTLACRFSGKGLLMVKIVLGEEKTGKRAVGYVYNTHLQAYEGEEKILDKQLNDIVDWTTDFKKSTHRENDDVKFDFLCGDFNFDNLSPGEAHLQNHPIYNIYEDPGRVRDGVDCPWVVGTELRPLLLWDKAISTPEGLRIVLQDPDLRHQFINDANIQKKTISELCHTLPQLDENGKMKLRCEIAGKRRIDRIFYRKESPVKIKAYNFISRLASLTDHIPVAMTVQISTNSS
ncbi:sphingomyelin phosphodiesterase 5 [Octopus bimaculoides]|uniref:sphingomyelin phosphodiesterase n=1 Tax=Octopus bimaculoides TaxID=37653 RepID=A0A0L8GQ92_OCTBM|nr:sphingomyelin phosphodiesterase 5 [Octopus bimaculoides]XP_014779266.1 sphingomyelin phosphodiesterase 5 [Octopus bimaculoides]XP_052831129.1 sphingomyelin phosphodiesterase 5 [Octopus bimaculoides]|eukprot:XP_014779265.1 PREDICTED: sphingomyelin phosphodiesterase 3-like [Octopus bimaculoides]